jgi:predicted esterase
MILLLAISFFLGTAAAAPEWRPGEIAPTVVCQSDAKQSYALYLPSSYSASGGKRWPILFLLDARGRGALAAEHFREGAEAHGYILASSNNSAGDAPWEPNAAAMRAMWNDTHRRFSIDPRRVYAGGFSAGARIASLLADVAPGDIAGVIGCGAGFAENRPPRKDTPFVYFGAVGNTDFNYQEMRELDAALASLGLAHRLSVFEGGHAWPPPAVCREALAWMELSAMKRGARPRDAALVESLARERLERASALEKEKRLAEARRLYLETAEDFDGLLDVTLARSGAARLGAQREVREAEKEEARRDEKERGLWNQLYQKLVRAVNAEEPAPPQRVVHELGIAGLLRKASAGSEAERLSAKRLIEALFVQASFYLPRQFFERKDAFRASLSLEVAVALKPDLGSAWYNLACARAVSGEKRKALAALRTAVELGFRDRAHIEKDSDLESLRGEKEYGAILAGTE